MNKVQQHESVLLISCRLCVCVWNGTTHTKLINDHEILRIVCNGRMKAFSNLKLFVLIDTEQRIYYLNQEHIICYGIWWKSFSVIFAQVFLLISMMIIIGKCVVWFGFLLKISFFASSLAMMLERRGEFLIALFSKNDEEVAKVVSHKWSILLYLQFYYVITHFDKFFEVWQRCGGLRCGEVETKTAPIFIFLSLIFPFSFFLILFQPWIVRESQHTQLKCVLNKIEYSTYIEESAQLQEALKQHTIEIPNIKSTNCNRCSLYQITGATTNKV